MNTLLQRCKDLGLDAEIVEAVRDSERYRWLRDSTPNALHLSRNGDHACNYMSAADWIDNGHPEWFADDPQEAIDAMKAADTIWCLQIYPDTPVGFYALNRATLDAAIDAAMQQEQQQ